MLTLTCAGSVGTLPCLGGFTCLAAGSGDGGGGGPAAGRCLLVVILVGQDDGGHDCGDDDRRRDRTSDDGQGPTTTSLLGAAFQLPLQFALGIRTSLFVGRHRRYPSMIAGLVRDECASSRSIRVARPVHDR